MPTGHHHTSDTHTHRITHIGKNPVHIHEALKHARRDVATLSKVIVHNPYLCDLLVQVHCTVSGKAFTPSLPHYHAHTVTNDAKEWYVIPPKENQVFSFDHIRGYPNAMRESVAKLAQELPLMEMMHGGLQREFDKVHSLHYAMFSNATHWKVTFNFAIENDENVLGHPRIDLVMTSDIGFVPDPIAEYQEKQKALLEENSGSETHSDTEDQSAQEEASDADEQDNAEPSQQEEYDCNSDSNNECNSEEEEDEDEKQKDKKQKDKKQKNKKTRKEKRKIVVS